MADDLCPHCQHLVDPHVLIATTDNRDDGGMMICPERDCPCVSTWGTNGNPAKVVPAPEAVEELRRRVQHGEFG